MSHLRGKTAAFHPAGLGLICWQGTQQFGLEGTFILDQGSLQRFVGLLSIFREHMRINVVIDLKVLVRSFNCENRACYVGNLRGSFFFRVRESIFFRESFAKVGYYNHYLKGCHPLPPGSGRRRALENSFWFWFSSLCGGACGQSHPS